MLSLNPANWFTQRPTRTNQANTLANAVASAVPKDDPTRLASAFNDASAPWSVEMLLEARKMAISLSYAKKARSIIRSNVIGDNQVRLLVEDDYTNKAWQKFTEDCTMHGWSWFELITTLCESLTVDGEILAQIVTDPEAPDNGNKSGVKIYYWDSAAINSPLDGVAHRQNGYLTTQGVTLDAYRRPIEYHVAPTATEEMKTAKLPAQDIIHLYDRVFARQVRGISPLYFAQSPLRHADIFRQLVVDDAIQRAKLSIIFYVKPELGDELVRAWQIQKPDEEADRQALLDRYLNKALNLEPGQKLGLDESVKPETMKGTGIEGQDYQLDHVEIIRDAAALLGLSYTTLAGDKRGNYAALRHDRMEDIALFKRYQAQIDAFILTVYNRWLMAMLQNGGDPNRELRILSQVRVIKPGFPPLDEQREAQANAQALNNGTDTRTRIAAENLGLDWKTEIYPVLLEESKLMADIVPVGMASDNSGTGNNNQSNGDSNGG